MREILFRAKRIDNGEWVEGNYFIDERDIEDCYIWRDVPQIQERYGDHYNYYDIIPETVGQYTGLTDKNGKKIFEGDLITVDNGIGYDARVYFDYGAFKRIPIHAGAASADLLYYLYESKDYEAIGNVHDNPKT